MPAACECGCGAEVRRRFVPGHQFRGPRPDRRRGATYDVSAQGCWLWTGSVDARGYGRWGDCGAHRRAYEEFVGPIPEGREVHHTCRERSCINPAHLVALTRAEHMAQHLAVARQRWEAWQALAVAGWTNRQIAEVFDVTSEGVRVGLQKLNSKGGPA